METKPKTNKAFSFTLTELKQIFFEEAKIICSNETEAGAVADEALTDFIGRYAADVVLVS